MEVWRKQCLLKYLGYYEGNVDGIWGKLSSKATADLQAASGLNADSIFGDGTLEAAKDAVANDKFKMDSADEQSQNQPPSSELEKAFMSIRYWSPAEFKCQCGGKYCNGFPAIPSRTLLELADDLRERAGGPARRSSGLRCQKWNAHEGGVSTSRHMHGKALDFCVPGVSGGKLLTLAQSDPRTRYTYQIKDKNGNLTDYIHVDVE